MSLFLSMRPVCLSRNGDKYVPVNSTFFFVKQAVVERTPGRHRVQHVVSRSHVWPCSPAGNGDEVARATTDTFGEFRIDKLADNSSQYELGVNSGSPGSFSTEFDLGDEGPYPGTLTLTA